MRPIRVLVVEDSLTIRKRLVGALTTDPEVQVIGEAADGKSAIELCRQLRPDVVSLDMMLPGVSGLAVTEYVMAYCPTPILIVSASINRGDLYNTYDALAAGAIDVLEKPGSDDVDEGWNQRFLSTVKLISRIRVITHMKGRRRTPWNPDAPAARPRVESGPYRLVAIGASTGGPAALVEILRNLPPDFPLPILLVIHLGDAFGRLMAEWLNSQSRLPVSCAVDGEPLPRVGDARVLLAPPGIHLVLCGNRIRLNREEERNSCRPSIDVLFESVAREMGSSSIACLLTGMGKDGAQGLLSIRRAGGRTLAQDQATSTVFGMPREAIALDAAESVMPLPEVAHWLSALASGTRLTLQLTSPIRNSNKGNNCIRRS